MSRRRPHNGAERWATSILIGACLQRPSRKGPRLKPQDRLVFCSGYSPLYRIPVPFRVILDRVPLHFLPRHSHKHAVPPIRSPRSAGGLPEASCFFLGFRLYSKTRMCTSCPCVKLKVRADPPRERGAVRLQTSQQRYIANTQFCLIRRNVSGSGRHCCFYVQ